MAAPSTQEQKAYSDAVRRYWEMSPAVEASLALQDSVAVDAELPPPPPPLSSPQAAAGSTNAAAAEASGEGRHCGGKDADADTEASTLAQVLYQMWLGAALLSKLQKDKTPLHQALRATKFLLKSED